MNESAQITSRFDEALAYATELHRNHRRKGSEIPYLSHLLQVAGIVLEADGDEDQAIAGLLHDAIEDADRCGADDATVRAEIKEKFGERVYHMVDACTDTEPGSEKGGRTPEERLDEWFGRKRKYLANLPQKSPDALLVSMADKLHNSRAILRDYRIVGEAIWDRFTPGKADTLWYYMSLVDGYAEAWGDAAPSLLDELRTTVADLVEVAMRDTSLR